MPYPSGNGIQSHIMKQQRSRLKISKFFFKLPGECFLSGRGRRLIDLPH